MKSFLHKTIPERKAQNNLGTILKNKSIRNKNTAKNIKIQEKLI